VRWFEIDPCYVFHGVNAYRDGARVVLDVCRLSSMFAPNEVLGGELSLRRWSVDTATGRVHDEVIEGDGTGELPTRDPRRVGRPHRYAYFVETNEQPDTVTFGGLIKRDYRTGRAERWEPRRSQHAGEWLFVPDPDGRAEDEGWLLTYVYDDATGSSELVVVDATEVPRGPVARVALPQRVPYGFHATWVA
jgi:carotenoid cleavage dioxygenase